MLTEIIILSFHNLIFNLISLQEYQDTGYIPDFWEASEEAHIQVQYVSVQVKKID